MNNIVIPMSIQSNTNPIEFNMDNFVGPISLDFTADIEMLPPGSEPIVEYLRKHFHFEVPVGDKGEKGNKGEKGDKGDTGTGISSAVLNQDYTLTINFTDGTSYTTGSIRGVKGEKGDTGSNIDNISKTSSSGLTDTYTITLTDSTTNTFNVTNGYSPTANVVKNDGVATITITDQNGTTTTTIADGANIPGAIQSETIDDILDGSYTP